MQFPMKRCRTVLKEVPTVPPHIQAWSGMELAIFTVLPSTAAPHSVMLAMESCLKQTPLAKKSVAHLQWGSRWSHAQRENARPYGAPRMSAVQEEIYSW